jgi:hypothetical protein
MCEAPVMDEASLLVLEEQAADYIRESKGVTLSNQMHWSRKWYAPLPAITFGTFREKHCAEKSLLDAGLPVSVDLKPLPSRSRHKAPA